MPSTWSQIFFHIVFSTKNRVPQISHEFAERLYPFMGGITRNLGGTLVAIGGMPDHVHLLVKWRTDEAISTLVRDVKARSTGWAHDDLGLHDFSWQVGGGVFTVTPFRSQRVEGYIRNQEEHHRTRSFQEEFEELLRVHGTEYDPKHL